ncbi:hypothetical protein CcI156_09735 [Frankia sp. CcI156]|uniref:Uncharacterized protein n=1 Tax=Frankia casuarinae (strain DSM 45818 / CECT 9043 / HFP020203 / CcI3) TaxID=106370 RepID=Q2J756_FRACC|nr:MULTISPECIES: hypothetical protein [Frankia]ABD12886.1 hypothetical protein Francci3_3534 [Frankia casuarinae]ETA03484.1 hypothetical protein CcI6DRAFT_00929 [Frankia sp. CcI6]EYT89941.1 hypothetical protein ThrDRAFT_04447 [Frankia casuarinae]KDA43671.1 hypothetical protein BMG523Draft_01331 [Frankia sp. BMG5.23]KEZ35636.1 hypothetical protein CEDDRAFT_02946 [Frankia sp. CeD]
MTGWPGWDGAPGGALRPALPDWVRADVERRSLLRTERRAGRGVRWARRRAAVTAFGWIAVASVTPVAAVVDGWGWLVVGAAAIIRAGLAGWETAVIRREDRGFALPSAPAPPPWALRHSAAAEPLRRGEAGLAALVAMARTLAPGAARGPVRAAVAGAADLVDGLRVTAMRVVACERAARAVTYPARRAEILATRKDLVAEMSASVATLDDLLAAASEVVGTVVASSPDLARLTQQIEALRGYAAALRELSG